MSDDDFMARPVPVVRGKDLQGLAAVEDHDGNMIVADGWVTIRCVSCSATGQVPAALADDVGANPETGEYSGLCGKCSTGRKQKFFGEDHQNRSARRAAKRRRT